MFKDWRPPWVRENQIFIVPSGRGLIFLALILVMVLTAATYGNNLIFILSFFLFALFVVTMLQTHSNLNGARLEFVGAEEAFAGGSLRIVLRLHQQRARARDGLWVRSRSRRFRTLLNERETMVAEERTKTVRVEVLAWRRGAHDLPEFILETYYPLGLFRAWMGYRPQGQVIVYPAAEGARVLELDEGQRGERDSGLRNTPDGDFGELKPYRAGESYHQIAWKHYARSGELLTKVHWGSDRRHYRIAWNPQPGEDLETYLKQMSRWIVNAMEEDASFELQTPQSRLEPGRGADHAKAGLRALAVVPREVA